MAKYSDDLKIKVVKEYQEGYLGIRPLAKKYGIKSKSEVGRWIQINEALETVKDCTYRTTIHSDQGWHYQHRKWVQTLKENKVFQSMSRKGNCLDNSPMESFFALLKQEMYHGEALCSYEELESKTERYINYYNNKRIKQKLAGMSPVQYRIHTSQIAV